MREIILDIESTGLNILQDRVIEIACIELFDKQPTGEELQIYIDPQTIIGEEATRIHGITNEMLIGKPFFKECWPEIKHFIGNSTIVAHNAPFDIGMINHELSILLEKPIKNQVIDTLTLARRKYSTNNSLDALAKRYKIKTERRLHGALKDCYILASVYYFLAITELEMENLSPLVSSEDVKFVFPIRKNPSIVSEEEIRLHREFLVKYNINI